MRLRDLLSNSRLFSFTVFAPASISFAATRCVRAVVLVNLKQPVSVERPVYRQSATSGVMGAPISLNMSYISSAVAAASPSSSSEAA